MDHEAHADTVHSVHHEERNVAEVTLEKPDVVLMIKAELHWGI